MMQMDAIWLHWPETKALAQAIQPIRFVGGCVRDALLSREVRDIDAATPLPPQEVIVRLKSAGMKAIPTGIDHGTVTAVAGARHFEITTLRRDVSTDGRRATVAFTDDWREDAARRDFTMNALYCDADGTIHDYFGGADDAKAGHIRFIGDARQRIREDALRILRFFRFFAHYGTAAVDAEGIEACGELAGLIRPLSGERIQQEMLKLLTSERAAAVVGLMQRHGVWREVMDITVMGETLDRLPSVLHKAGQAPDPVIALALLVRSSGRDKTVVANDIAIRWKLSRAHHKKLLALCEAPVPSPSTGEGQGGGDTTIPPSSILPRKGGGELLWKKQIRAWGAEPFTERALLAMAEGAEENAALAAIKLAREWQVPSFPVSGDDLIAHGLTPGREMGEMLRSLEEAWEESGYMLDKTALLKKLPRK